MDGIFTASETHGRTLRTANRIIAESQFAGWRSLYAAIFEEAPLDTNEAAVGHPSLIYHISRPTEVTRRLDGGAAESQLIGPGRICLTPGGSVAEWRHSGRPQILQLYIRSSFYQSAVREFHGRDTDQSDVAARFAISDPLLEQLVLAVFVALREGQIEDGLYVDSLAQMIAAHLARYHGADRGQARPPRMAGLWGAKIRRLLDFIEDRIDQDLGLEAMAAEVGMGPVHLSRVFKHVVGTSPHRYVLQRRLERARMLLGSSELTISEVALASGFCSQSHLTTVFGRMFGMSPGAYRKGL